MGLDDSASGRYSSYGRHGRWEVRGRCHRRRQPRFPDFFFGVDGFAGHGSAYGGFHGGYGGYPEHGGYPGYPGHGLDNYDNHRGGGPGAYGGGYGHGGYGGYGGGSMSQHDYSRHDHSQNMHQSSQFSNGRNGLYDARQRHADESYLDETGHDMTMTDRYGQRASEDDHSLDTGRRTADSQDLHIRRPDGSMVDSSQRDGSVDTMSQDNHDRSFSGPNGFANESEQDFSQNDSQFSDSNERITN